MATDDRQVTRCGLSGDLKETLAGAMDSEDVKILALIEGEDEEDSQDEEQD